VFCTPGSGGEAVSLLVQVDGQQLVLVSLAVFEQLAVEQLTATAVEQLALGAL
jgi:hypothetical protein